MFLLPNVSGMTNVVEGWGQQGAFYKHGETILNGITNEEGLTRLRVGFDASRSLSIYKSVSKINVRSAYALMIIKT